MIRAYHAIFAAYGFWLPNDPRGSWSDYVRRWELLRFGKATTTDQRRSLARDAHDADLRREAKGALVRNPVRFTGEQARHIALSFDAAGYPIHACSVMPDHVHLVLGRTGVRAEQMVRRLKQLATMRLRTEKLWSEADSPWARKGWVVYLNTANDVARAIRYVNLNPVRAGRRQQRWSFVTPWNGRSD